MTEREVRGQARAEQIDLRNQVAQLQQALAELRNVPGRMEHSKDPVPPLFYGKIGESFRTWLGHFDVYGDSKGWNDAEKLLQLPNFLRGDAWEYYEELIDAQKDTYDHLKTNLNDKLTNTGTTRVNVNALFERYQRPTESVQEFENSLKRLLRTAYPDNENVLTTFDPFLLTAFTRGLSPLYKEKVIAANPPTFAEAVAKAKSLEGTRALLDGTATPQNPSAIADTNSHLLTTCLRQDNNDIISKLSDSLVALASQKGNTEFLPPKRSEFQENSNKMASKSASNIDYGNQSDLAVAISAMSEAMKNLNGTLLNQNYTRNRPNNRNQGQNQTNTDNNNEVGRMVNAIEQLVARTARNTGSNRRQTYGQSNVNFRSPEGQNVCNFCNKVGHIALRCWHNPESPAYKGIPRNRNNNNNGGYAQQAHPNIPTNNRAHVNNSQQNNVRRPAYATGMLQPTPEYIAYLEAELGTAKEFFMPPGDASHFSSAAIFLPVQAKHCTELEFTYEYHELMDELMQELPETHVSEPVSKNNVVLDMAAEHQDELELHAPVDGLKQLTDLIDEVARGDTGTAKQTMTVKPKPAITKKKKNQGLPDNLASTLQGFTPEQLEGLGGLLVQLSKAGPATSEKKPKEMPGKKSTRSPRKLTPKKSPRKGAKKPRLEGTTDKSVQKRAKTDSDKSNSSKDHAASGQTKKINRELDKPKKPKDKSARKQSKEVEPVIRSVVTKVDNQQPTPTDVLAQMTKLAPPMLSPLKTPVKMDGSSAIKTPGKNLDTSFMDLESQLRLSPSPEKATQVDGGLESLSDSQPLKLIEVDIGDESPIAETDARMEMDIEAKQPTVEPEAHSADVQEDPRLKPEKPAPRHKRYPEPRDVEMDRCKLEVKQLEGRIRELTLKLSENSRTVTRLRSERDTARGDAESYHTEVIELSAENRSLKEELDSWRAKVKGDEELTKKLEEAEQKVKRQNKLCHYLAGVLSNLFKESRIQATTPQLQVILQFSESIAEGDFDISLPVSEPVAEPRYEAYSPRPMYGGSMANLQYNPTPRIHQENPQHRSKNARRTFERYSDFKGRNRGNATPDSRGYRGSFASRDRRGGKRGSGLGSSMVKYGLGILAICYLLAPAVATNPMLCQTHEGRQIFKLPSKIHCTNDILERGPAEILLSAKIALYRRNHIQYKSKAWACKKVHTSVKSLTYFFNENRMREVEKKQVETSAEECRKMKLWHQCSAGQLITKGSLWQTTNEPDWEFPPGYFQCCKWHVSEATNCFMYDAIVYKRHNSPEMESTAGVVSHCEYAKGECQLKDGTYLLWEPDEREHCAFLPWQTMSGQRFGSNWLSSDGNLALTHGNNEYVEDCKGKRLRMSEQGIPFYYITGEVSQVLNVTRSSVKALKYAKRVKRASKLGYQDGGPVPTEVLAASLQALNFDLRSSIRFAFKQAMAATCRAMSTVLEILKTDILANPTLAMRALLKRDTIIARAGGQSIEVWPCALVPDNTYHFLPMNGSCTNEVPVQFSTHGQYHHGYMDPRTNIIHKKGIATDCALDEEIPIRLRNETMLYHRSTGQVRPAQHLTELDLIPFNLTTYAPTKPTIFHQVVMYNWSELQTHVTLNDLMGTISAQQQLFAELGVRNHFDAAVGAQQAISNMMTQGFFGFLHGLHIDPIQLWVFACCLVVTFTVTFRFCCPSMLDHMQFSMPTQAIHLLGSGTGAIRSAWNGVAGRTQFDRVEMTAPPPPYNSVAYHAQPEEAPLIRIVPAPRYRPLIRPKSPVQLVGAILRKAAATVCAGIPNQLLPVEAHSPPIVAASINGTKVEALLDTGSSVSVISSELAGQLNCRWHEPVMAATSMTQHDLDLTRAARVSIRLGGRQEMHTIHVLENSPHICLLGTDFLRKFGKIEFDFERLQVNIPNGGTVRFSTECTPPRADVFLGETVDMPPLAEVVMPAHVRGLFRLPKFVMVEPKTRIQADRGVFVARTLNRLHGPVIPVRLLNANPYPVKLYAQTVIGCAEPALDATLVAAMNRTSPDKPKNDVQPKWSVNDVDLSNSDLTEEQKGQLMNLLRKNESVFAKNEFDLGRTSTIQHRIDVGDHPPISQRAYRIPHAQLQVVKEHLDKMLKQGLISPSTSPWASPIVLVKKKTGETRFCTDYRRLNRITRKDVHPIPRIDELLDSLANANYMTTLDMASGYWQVEVEPESRDKTAFKTMFGLFEWNVMPFGLTNAPSAYQRLMEFVLAGLQWDICLCYIDDVIVISPTFEQHLEHLQKVFDRFESHGLKLKGRKCKFAHSEVEFLGHMVSKDGLKPEDAKVAAVKNFPIPVDQKTVRQFLGLASYYRRFIQNFAAIATPLHKLLRKEARFYWTDNCEKAFQSLKGKLIAAPVLAYPDYNKPFLLATDASEQGLGAVLSQLRKDGKEHPIAYASRTLHRAEKNYSTTEKEALSIVWACKYFRPYLYGNKVSVTSDHAPLRWLMTCKNPSPRLQRWGLSLMEYDLGITYKKGKSNTNADALSRCITENKNERMPEESKQRNESVCLAVFAKPPSQLRKTQLNDKTLLLMIEYLEDGKLPTSGVDAFLETTNEYFIHKGVLMHTPPKTKPFSYQFPAQLVVPESMREEVLEMCHDDLYGAHLGPEKTLDRVSLRYFWPGMNEAIKQYCKTCHQCTTKKNPHQKACEPLHPLPVVNIFERVAVDVLGPLHLSLDGNKFVVVFSDYMSKWPEAFAVPDVTAPTIARIFMEQICCRHGTPLELLSDCGTNFLSALVAEVCKLCDTRKINTTTYHPACNGLVERFNKTLTNMISMYVSAKHDDWDRIIPYVLFAYRTSVQASTGYSPAFLLYGRDLRMPSDAAMNYIPSMYVIYDEDVANQMRTWLTEARVLAKQNLAVAQDRQKRQHDKKVAPLSLKEQDIVYVHTPVMKPGMTKKFFHPWHGPYKIVKLKHPNAWIEPQFKKGNIEKVHISRLKKAETRPTATQPNIVGGIFLKPKCSALVNMEQTREATQWNQKDEMELQNLKKSAGCIADVHGEATQDLHHAKARVQRLTDWATLLEQRLSSVRQWIAEKEVTKQEAWALELESELEQSGLPESESTAATNKEGGEPQFRFEPQFRLNTVSQPRLDWGNPFFNRVFTPALRSASQSTRSYRQ